MGVISCNLIYSWTIWFFRVSAFWNWQRCAENLKPKKKRFGVLILHHW